MAQTVKNSPATQETWVQSLGREDPLEKGIAPHSSILAWRIPMDRGAWWATSMGLQRARHDYVTNHSTAQCVGMYIYIYTMEYYSAKKKGDFVIFNNVDGPARYYV